jgi:hypothetical protein
MASFQKNIIEPAKTKKPSIGPVFNPKEFRRR